MCFRFVFSIGVALLMFGCKIASYEPVDLYEGPSRPDSEIAIIGQCSGCFPREKAIDGGDVFVTNIGRVLPGKHVLSVKLYPFFGQGNFKPAVFEINVEAGRKYLVSSMVLDRKSRECEVLGHLMPSDKKTFIWLEDQLTGKVVGGHRPWLDAKVVKTSAGIQYWPQNQTENRTKPKGLEEFSVCMSSKTNLNPAKQKGRLNYGEGIIPWEKLDGARNLYFYANWDDGFEGH